MATVRLGRENRDRIQSNFVQTIAPAFAARRAANFQAVADIGSIAFQHYRAAEFKRLGWSNETVKELSAPYIITSGDFTVREINGAGLSAGRIEYRFHAPLPFFSNWEYNDGVYKGVTRVIHKLEGEVYDLLAARIKEHNKTLDLINEQERAYRDKAYQTLNACSTLGQLLEVWPEAWEYTTASMRKEHERVGVRGTNKKHLEMAAMADDLRAAGVIGKLATAADRNLSDAGEAASAVYR